MYYSYSTTVFDQKNNLVPTNHIYKRLLGLQKMISFIPSKKKFDLSGLNFKPNISIVVDLNISCK